MDGTLLPDLGRDVSPRNRRALLSAQQAGVTVAIATGRRTNYTVPMLDGFGLRADMPLITSNGAVLRTLGGKTMDRCTMDPEVARDLCGLLRPFGCLVFTFERPDGKELLLEDMDTAQNSIALWIEANRKAIEVVRPLEKAFEHCDSPEQYPIQGMVAGSVERMRQAEAALKASPLAAFCGCVKTEYLGRNISILDLLPKGVSKGTGIHRLADHLGIDRKEVMAIGDNWNDLAMLEWAGQAVVMGNASPELRTLAKTRGWKQAPPNTQDGVAVTLEAALSKQLPTQA
jgi:Cof subfamily protein (haloacid dehalogenase superfamily)